MLRVDSRLQVPESIVADILSLSVPGPGGCLLWTGYTRNGYGSISHQDKQEYVHRIMLAHYSGPLPDGICSLHSCDIQNCISEDHLFRGTKLDNVDDMRAKGRGVDPPVVRGERHPKAHVDDANVAKAIELLKTQKQREVARILGVSQSTVWRWLHLKTRAHA